MSGSGSARHKAPLLRIVRGEPTAEELAVVTALVGAASGSGDEPVKPLLRGRWSDPALGIRSTPQFGPGAWRSAVR